MGFGNKSRKEAKAAQEASLALQRQQFDAQNSRLHEYENSFATRNAGVIQQRDKSQNWLGRFEKGEDVSSLNPAFAKTAQESADAVTNSMQFAGKLGDNATHNAGGDADYQAKLRSVSQRKIAGGVAQLNMGALQDEVANQRGILMDTSNFLNADSRAAFGMGGQVFDYTSTMFNNATTKRQMEMNRSNMMMGNLMGLISGGIQGGMKAFGA
jgi:hypothetical protein